jgi:hypothetical protein
VSEPDEPAVTVLVDADDDAALTRALLEAHDPAGGRVVVHPTPAVTSLTMLARDVLLALGRPIEDLAVQRISASGPAFKAAAAWMIADGIRQVIVLRAHLLGAAGWEQLIEMADCAGARLVLVRHTLTGRWEHERVLAGVAHHVTKDVTEVVPGENRTAPPRPVPGAEPVADLPRLPAGDVHQFLPDAWRRLDAADYARVAAVYARGRDAACRWLAAHPERPPDRRTSPGIRSVFPAFLPPAEIAAGLSLMDTHYGGEALRDITAGLLCTGREWSTRRAGAVHGFSDSPGLHLFLAELVADSPTRRHTVALLRGAQAGFLLHGLHLALPANLATTAGPGLNTVVVTAEVADRLRAGVAHPVHAAAVATAMFTGLDADVLNLISVEALSGDAAALRTPLLGGVGRLGGAPASFFVPPAARPLLAAARAFVHLRGGDARGRLL